MIYNDSKYNIEWDVKTLNQLGKFTRGKSKHRPRNDKKLFVNGKYPLIQTGEIRAANLFVRNHTDMYNDFGLKQSKLWPKNTLCITIAANIAETALLGYPMCFPDSVVGFNAYPNESSEIFMHYVFTYIKKAIQNSASGSIQDNINVEFLTTLNFRVPKKEYQDKIVAILSSFDSKIELNNCINAELEAMAKTLYDYWFVQFDFPDAKGKPYKTSGGKMVWNEELKREVPVGWEVKSLNEIADLKAGGDKPKIYSEIQTDTNRIPIYSNGITNDGLYGFTNEARILKPSITISARGTIGYCVLRNKPFVPIIRLIVVAPNKSYEANFLYERIKSLKFENSGSVQQQLTVPQISGLKFVMPTSQILMKYDAMISSGMNKIESNKEENQQLSQLRDWLLPMLMNGQVTVKDMEEESLSMVAEPVVPYGKKKVN